jgi:hypothetical protein
MPAERLIAAVFGIAVVVAAVVIVTVLPPLGRPLLPLVVTETVARTINITV